MSMVSHAANTHLTPRGKVAIYVGQGADISSAQKIRKLVQDYVQNRLTVQEIESDYFTKKDWESDTKLIVFPGGQATQYAKTLKGDLNKKIATYVSNGGRYLGICAGGYYGARDVLYDEGKPSEIRATRELGFFPGQAVGPVFKKPNESHTPSSPHPRLARITCTDQPEPVLAFHDRGCRFVKADQYPSVKVIARYDEPDCHDEPAAVLCHVGKGKAILTGVHPEYDPEDIQDVSPQIKPNAASWKGELLRELTDS